MSNGTKGGLWKEVVVLYRTPLSFLQETDVFVRKFKNMIHLT